MDSSIRFCKLLEAEENAKDDINGILAHVQIASIARIQ
jgi:hypothetical protein